MGGLTFGGGFFGQYTGSIATVVELSNVGESAIAVYQTESALAVFERAETVIAVYEQAASGGVLSEAG